MKTIWNYLKDFYSEQNKYHLLFVALFLIISIHLNYKWDIENGIIDVYYKSIQHLYLYFLLYSVGFIGIYLSYAYNAAGRKMLMQKGLWLRIFTALIIFSIYCYIYQYNTWIEQHVKDYHVSSILKICANQIVQATVMFMLVFIFWWFMDRKKMRLYGWKLQNSHVQIYFWMLMAMIPIVIAASFTKDFQSYYPTVKKIFPYITENMHKGRWIALYELCYGMEFLHIEFFFRGFLILAFVRYAGSKAILPAAVFYCFIHFGKPMGECVSSFFGGLILGILSYRSESIVAGVFIHLGIALLMELVAGLWMLTS